MKTLPLTFFVTLMLLLLCVFGCDKPSADPSVYLAQLGTLEAIQDDDLVIQKATECLCIPGIDSTQALEIRSFAFFRQGNYEASLKDDFRITQMAHARCRSKGTAWEEIGYKFQHKFGNYLMALWAYERGIQCGLDCNSPYQANFNRIHIGQLYSKMNRYPEAVDAFESILATGDTAKAWLAKVNLMHIHLKAGNPSKCIALGYEVNRMQPWDDFQSFWMASAFDSLGQRDSACLYYRRAAALGHPKAATIAAQCPQSR